MVETRRHKNGTNSTKEIAVESPKRTTQTTQNTRSKTPKKSTLKSDEDTQPLQTSSKKVIAHDDIIKSTEKEVLKKPEVHHEFEFGGPIGTFFVTVGLPIVIYALYFFCNKDVCFNSPLSFSWSQFRSTLPSSWSSLISYEALYIYLGWMAFHVILERVLPGETAEGVALPDGKKLKYTISGHLQFWVTILAMGHALPIYNATSSAGVYEIKGFMPLPLYKVYDHYLELITISILGALLLSIYLYISSFRKGLILAQGGDTGYAMYDFFIGRELNPRIGSLDLKEFCELRPGLIGWAVLNLGMACKQYMLHKAISMSMLLVTLLQGLYVWDALYQVYRSLYTCCVVHMSYCIHTTYVTHYTVLLRFLLICVAG